MCVQIIYQVIVILLLFSGTLVEFVDRFDLSELSEIEGFSDDEDADPTWHLPPPPRIEVVFDEGERRPTSDDDEDEPRPTFANADEGEPRPIDVPNPDNMNIGLWEPCGWKIQEYFNPLPPAPPHENTVDLEYLSTIELFEK